MRSRLIILLIGIFTAVFYIGCGRDNNAVIKEKVSKAEELKENGKEQEAMETLLDASYRINDKTPLSIQTSIYTELGGLFYENHKLEDAGRYFQKAVDVARAHDSIASYPHLLWNLVLTINDIDSAKAILSECRDLSDLDKGNYQFYAIRSRLNLAKACVIENDIETAKSTLDSILPEAKADNILKIESTMERAIVYLAEDELGKGIDMLHELPFDSLSLDGKLEQSNLLCKAYRAMGDYESALNCQDSVMTYMDSIQSMKSSEQISRIEREFDQRIAKEQREREIIIYTGSAFVILLIIMILLLNRNRRLRARQVSLVEKISRLNIELSKPKENPDASAERKSDAIISRLRLTRELFATLPHYGLIAQANLEQNAEDISKDIQKELYNSIVARFSDVCNNLKDEYPALSSEDMMLGIMTYARINKDVISVLLKSSDDALRQRKSRMKKKIPTELFDLFFCKTV
ncbi:MAG: hypothetical protein K2L45_04215 [Muribaculaceae bacterium]|nr:hypothetical protein [Muribaculaceae bacterium]